MLQSVIKMAQEQLLQDDQIKKELEDTIKLKCYHCAVEEDVDIYDSMKNTSPFFCSNCCKVESYGELTMVEEPFCNLFLTLIQLTYYSSFLNGITSK